MPDLLLRGGRPWGRPSQADILIADGAIAGIDPQIDAPGAEPVDISGRLMLPGLVEAHCHLDKILLGGAVGTAFAGDSLAERFANDRRRRKEWDFRRWST